MSRHPYLHLDVFTRRALAGNQLAIFLHADDLSPEVMQRIALEMAFPETTFVLAPQRADTDVKMHIFTPRCELPLAGHPTIGSTFALASEGVIGPDRDDVVFELGVGPTPASLECGDDDATAYSRMFAPAFGIPETPPPAAPPGPWGRICAITGRCRPRPRARWSACRVSRWVGRAGYTSRWHRTAARSPPCGLAERRWSSPRARCCCSQRGCIQSRTLAVPSRGSVPYSGGAKPTSS